MLGLTSFKKQDVVGETTKGFDDFELTLGDVLRGERATLGKSLMDVQRELKIKAAYIAAVEDADPAVFDTPGFISGYVRSYAKYLELDADWAFEKFCKESGFSTANGMSPQASPAQMSREDRLAANAAMRPDLLTQSATPFAPPSAPMFERINVKAIGSSLVLLLLVGGLGLGAFRVVEQVQMVQLAPIEQPPMVLTDLDPLALVMGQTGPTADQPNQVSTLADLYASTPEIPDLAPPRDGPIARLDPNREGAFVAPAIPEVTVASVSSVPEVTLFGTQAVEDPTQPIVALNEIAIFPTAGAWMHIVDGDGNSIYRDTMEPGERLVVPTDADQGPYRIASTGMSGYVYFQVNGAVYGPAGTGTRLVKGVELSETVLKERYLEVPADQRGEALEKALVQLEDVVASQ